MEKQKIKDYLQIKIKQELILYHGCIDSGDLNTAYKYEHGFALLLDVYMSLIGEIWEEEEKL